MLFTVVILPEKIKILYPNGGETLFSNKNIENIKWSADKEIGDVVILLYQNGIKLFEIQKVVRLNPNINIQSYLWKYIPKLKAGKGFRIRIRSLKDLTINDFSDFDFTIKSK